MILNSLVKPVTTNNKRLNIRTLKLFVRSTNGIKNSSQLISLSKCLENIYGNILSVSFNRNSDTLRLSNHGWIEFENPVKSIEKSFYEFKVPKFNDDVNLNDLKFALYDRDSHALADYDVLQVKVETALENYKPSNKTSSLGDELMKYESHLLFNKVDESNHHALSDLESYLISKNVNIEEIKRKIDKESSKYFQSELNKRDNGENVAKISSEDYKTLATQNDFITPATPRFQLSSTSTVERAEEDLPKKEDIVEKQENIPKPEKKKRTAAEERAFKAGIESHRRQLEMQKQKEIENKQEQEQQKSSSSSKSFWNLFR